MNSILGLVFKLSYLHKVAAWLLKPYGFIKGRRTEILIALYVICRVMEHLGWLPKEVADQIEQALGGGAAITAADKFLRVWRMVGTEIQKQDGANAVQPTK